jgi:hypothetical protein
MDIQDEKNGVGERDVMEPAEYFLPSREKIVGHCPCYAH